LSVNIVSPSSFTRPENEAAWTSSNGHILLYELASIVSKEMGRGETHLPFLEKVQSLPNIVEQILKKAKAITQIGDGF
jgi:hypothetical protein